MHNIEQLHDGGTIIGDGGVALVVMDELVHSSGAQRRAHGVRHRGASIDVAHHLCLPLGGVRPFLQQYDLGLL